MQEIWKVYKDTRHYRKDGTVYQGGLYEVSNFGRVKKNGEIVEPKIYSGYKRIANLVFVHRAVAELFIPNPENKPQVDHINTIKTDNRTTNLQWVTAKENMNNPLTIKRIHSDEWRKNVGNKGKHKVWDNKELNKYHFE